MREAKRQSRDGFMKYRFLPAILGGALIFTPPQYQPFKFPHFEFDPFSKAPARPSPALHAHSHNDFERERPLIDALEHRFYSVEADVRLRAGEVVVSHLGLSLAGKLRDLYLDPLQRRVSRYGTVNGDGQDFLLWLDVGDSSPEFTEELHALLASYPMLTRFTDQGGVPGPVTVVLSGNRENKKRYSEKPLRFACHDSSWFTVNETGSAPAWCWYSLNWTAWFGWDGQGTIPDRDRRLLTFLVKNVREKGRKLRFWNAPETPEAWSAALDAGVDLVATDSPGSLAEFLGSRISRALASPSETQ